MELNPEPRLRELSEQGPAFRGLWEEDAVTGRGVTGRIAIPWPHIKRTEVPD